jgi:hypothetical protein
VARLVTVLVGVAGTAIALVMASHGYPHDLLTVLEFMGLLGGTLSGLFLLGIFSRRAGGRGALAGAYLECGAGLCRAPDPSAERVCLRADWAHRLRGDRLAYQPAVAGST